MKNIFAFFLILTAGIAGQPMRSAFINGNIYTVNPAQPRAEAVVAEAGRIIYVGTTAGAKALLQSGDKVTDLMGKFMMPGFIDNHVHFMAGGFYLNGIDLRGAKTTGEFAELIRQYAAGRSGKWITGGDWDHEQWEVKDLPQKEWIDGFTKDIPVLVYRFDGHMGLANSKALALAGITKDTPSPDGGLIVKNPVTGEPTGILKDNAINLVTAVIPDPSPEEYYAAGLSALGEAKRFGVTSVQDITYQKDLATYQQLERNGKLTCRIYTRLPIADYTNLTRSGIQTGFGNELLKIGSLKGFVDGSLGSSTAWFFDPFKQDTTTSGLPNDIVTDGRLRKWAMDADRNRLQLCIHAIGDRANDFMLTLYEDISKENPKWDRRFRIEHAQHVRFKDIPRFAAAGVIASVQPYHCIDDGVWAEKRIGNERIQYTYPFRSFLDAGVKLSFGTDWTVAPINPLLGIYAAVTRRTLDGKNPDGWIPEQKITVAEAITCYTINSAYAAFEEADKGSITVGKLADFTILDADITVIEPVKIKEVQVLQTILGGEIVYTK